MTYEYLSVGLNLRKRRISARKCCYIGLFVLKLKHLLCLEISILHIIFAQSNEVDIALHRQSFWIQYSVQQALPLTSKTGKVTPSPQFFYVPDMVRSLPNYVKRFKNIRKWAERPKVSCKTTTHTIGAYIIYQTSNPLQ